LAAFPEADFTLSPLLPWASCNPSGLSTST